VYEKVFSMQHYAMLRNLIFYDFFLRSEFYCVFFFDYFSAERRPKTEANDNAFLSQGDMCTKGSRVLEVILRNWRSGGGKTFDCDGVGEVFGYSGGS
jgi:hypothetical protein